MNLQDLTPNSFSKQFKDQDEFSSFISDTYKKGLEKKFDDKFNTYLENH